MRLLLILLNCSLVAWAASDVPEGAAGAGAARPVGARASTEVDIDRIATILAGLPREKQDLFLLAGSINGHVADGDDHSALEDFRTNYSTLKTFDVGPLNEGYYRTLVEGVSIAISLQAERIGRPLQAIARGTHPLKEALPKFDTLKSTLDMLASLYLESKFTFKETDTPDIRAPHFYILNKLEAAYYALHNVVMPLYDVEINAHRKGLLERACECNERAVTAGQDVCESSVLDGRRIQHAMILLQLYQIPPFDKKREYKSALGQIRKSFREQPNHSTGLDALLEATEAFDGFCEARAKLTAEVSGRRDERYMRIYEERMHLAKAKLAELAGIANRILAQKSITPTDFLKAQVSILNIKLSMHTPSLIGRHTLEVSAPRPPDQEGLTILDQLEDTVKDLVRVERDAGPAKAVSAAAAASAATEEITLLDIYRRYAMHFPVYKENMIENSFLLVRNSQFEKALQRLEILTTIEKESGKVVGGLTEWTGALCRGYMGDWGPYNALRAARDAALEAERTAKGARREAVKASAQEIIVAQIRAAQEVVAAKKIEADSARAAADASRTARLRAPVEPGTGVGMSLADRVEEAAIARMHEAERGTAARDRAAARAAAKTFEADMPAAAAGAGASGRGTSISPSFAAAGAGAAAGASGSDIAVDLTSLFDLKGTARTVEAEITGNTWKITRKDLITYFTNLGCTIRQTKGSHTMVEIPDLTEILVEGQVIAVIPDEGGAGTLPGWDGNHFPPYLIPQMRTLRSILAVSAGATAARLAEKQAAAAAAEAELMAGESSAKSGKAGAKGNGSGGKGKKR